MKLREISNEAQWLRSIRKIMGKIQTGAPGKDIPSETAYKWDT